MDNFEFEGMEIINSLLSVKGNYNIEILSDPETDLFYIYLDGAKFATFEDDKNAVIIADMMQLHIGDYSHML